MLVGVDWGGTKIEAIPSPMTGSPSGRSRSWTG
jgi:hypothetical protein